MEGSWRTNGALPPGCGNQEQPSSSRPKLRMPTVHDALPFTPLPSIIPFNPDVIQPPSAAPVVPPKFFSNYDEVNKSKVVLDQLSAGATNAETASKRCQQSIRDVQRLLDPGSLTSLVFRHPRPSNVRNEAPEPATKKTPTATLSSFAKMILDNTSTHFHYLTPAENSPEPGMEPSQQPAPPMVAPSLNTQQSSVKLTDAVDGRQLAQQSAGPTSSAQLRQVSTVIPRALSEAQRAEYQYMPDQDSIAGAQYLTPSKPPTSSSVKRGVNLAQREQSNQHLVKLQGLITDILEKEDQMQPDTSGQVSAAALEIFEPLETQDSKPVPRAVIQTKLEKALDRVVSAGRLAEVETYDLQRVQRLCDAPVTSTDSLSFSISEDWSEQDEDEWRQRIGLAAQGLSASRTLVLIITGGAHIQELQTEDHLSKILYALVAVIERCIMPLAEERPTEGERTRGDKSRAATNRKFVVAFNNKQVLQPTLDAALNTIRSLGELLVTVDVEESLLSRLETLCKLIIFAENASMEKDSAVGCAKFETLRQTTMDLYARIFTKYPDQRQYIVDEILSSLEKLPATRQSARQFRPQGTKPIQLVSALIMRLVQTSATRTVETSKPRVQDEEYNADDASDEADSDEETIQVAKKKPRAKSGSLLHIVQPLHDAALGNAQYIIKTIIEKALATTKSSDEPFRRLLDIFVEDFLNVLGSSDWPAAEVFLRSLVWHMISIAETAKYPVPARTLALELLGVIGSGITELQINARHAEQSIDMTEEMGDRVKELFQQTESGSMDKNDLVAFDGPYRICAEYLNEKGTEESALLQSAHGYTLMQWAYTAVSEREALVDSAGGGPGLSGDLQVKLREMLLDPRWLDDRSTLRIGASIGRLAVLVVTLNSRLCKAFPKIISVLMSGLGSEHSTIKSRSLKSINALLEKDPRMLDRSSTILNHIARCLQDTSALVRESSLGLLQKCMTLRPKLEARVYTKIIERTRDNNTNARKRAMKMLKEVYLHNQDNVPMRSTIIDAILWRLEDTEESVSELSRTTMEEVWFRPFHGMKLGSDGAVNAKLAFHAHAALVIATIDRDARLLAFLESLTRRFTAKSKTQSANNEVCKTMVTVLFNGIIDNSDIPGSPTQCAILRSLSIFAKATPTLFTASQLERLEPYTQNLKHTDDLEAYRYVITILRYVMPHLQMTMKRDFVQTMQNSLLGSVPRLAKPELREVAPCLWTTKKILGNVERLANFVRSALVKIYAERNKDLSSDANAAKLVSRLMPIVSEFGNACDFDAQLALFTAKGHCDWYKGDSVAGLIVEAFCNFTSPKHPVGVRRTAIDGVCTVAQAWPAQFGRTDVLNAIQTVFKDRIPELEIVVLAGLEAYFQAQEKPEEGSDASELPAGIASGSQRLGRTYVASDSEGATTSLAQRFLASILRVALASYSEPAFIAARVVVSVNKQGLVHPNESCAALVALESCPNKSVATTAFKEHKAQHLKHESVYEKEYMRAVQQTFEYQRDIIGNSLGYADGANTSAKMHLLYEVLKTGKAAVRKKFLARIAQKMDFDPAKLDMRASVPTHVAFVRFCCENLALFEYDKVEDLLHLLASLEMIFSSTGSSVAQAIESDVLKMHVDDMPGSEGMVNGTSDTAMTESTRGDLEPARLRQVCVSAQTLAMIWETRNFLHRVWNLQKHMVKTKGKDKDANKTPSRAGNAQTLTIAYLKRVSEIVDCAGTEQEQQAMCKAFVDLISIDTEVKVNSDNEENIDMSVLANGYDTPSESSGRKSPSVDASGGGRGRKRKASMSAGATPRKRGKPKKSASFNTAVDGDEEGGWD